MVTTCGGRAHARGCDGAVSRRPIRDPASKDAEAMRKDPSARKLYGHLWPLLADLWALAPHTDLPGIATLLALCAPRGDVDDFCSRLRRPRPGRRESARQWMARGVPPCRDATLDLCPNDAIVSWVADKSDRRLWAVVGLVWGLSPDELIASYEEMCAIGARSSGFDVPEVEELAAAAPGCIPGLLAVDMRLDAVCSSFAHALGVPQTASIEVTLPAALGAICAALTADPTVGIAALAILIRARSVDGVTPDSLVHMCRPGSEAHRLATVLSRLWAHALHDHPFVKK